MESYTYLFLFVLQLVFTVVVLLALLHEKRLQKQLEKKNKQLLTELLNLRGEIRAMRSTYLTFTGKIVRISVSTTTASEELKKLISATEKLKKELERIKAAPSRNIKKLPVSRKQPLPVNPTLGSKARKKKRLQTGVAYGRS
ncbi:uncharacterized protein BN535_01781 [Bacteroides caccae CAG:21]|nr:uncharacterized protein BN535_01781 [Bacteroides caccae CAG:21]